MKLFTPITLPILAAVIALTTGCEVEPTDDATVTVSPNFATIRQGESIAFTASGWTGYTWSLDNDAIGALNTRSGATVIYTATADSAALQTLRVGAGEGGTSTGGSNSTDEVFVADAVNIQHEWLNPTNATDETTALAIHPASATVSLPGTNGYVVQFSASGGTPPYSWSTTKPTVGTINASGTYTPSGAIEDNVVILQDSAGTIIEATVTATDGGGIL